MKHFVSLLIVAVLCSCGSQKELASLKESVEDSYFERWVAGIRGGGSGINVHITFKAPLEAGVILEKVTFKGFEVPFAKQDERHFMAQIVTRKGNRDNTEDSTEMPLPESNTAELLFSVDGKSVVYTIENVREKEMLAYPVMNKPRD